MYTNVRPCSFALRGVYVLDNYTMQYCVDKHSHNSLHNRKYPLLAKGTFRYYIIAIHTRPCMFTHDHPHISYCGCASIAPSRTHFIIGIRSISLLERKHFSIYSYWPRLSQWNWHILLLNVFTNIMYLMLTKRLPLRTKESDPLPLTIFRVLNIWLAAN